MDSNRQRNTAAVDCFAVTLFGFFLYIFFKLIFPSEIFLPILLHHLLVPPPLPPLNVSPSWPLTHLIYITLYTTQSEMMRAQCSCLPLPPARRDTQQAHTFEALSLWGHFIESNWPKLTIQMHDSNLSLSLSHTHIHRCTNTKTHRASTVLFNSKPVEEIEGLLTRLSSSSLPESSITVTPRLNRRCVILLDP